MAHSEGWCFRAVPALSDEVSRRIHTIPCVANRFPAFSCVAAVDRKWSSGAVLDVSNDQNRLDQPRAVRINREITPATPETSQTNYFRFAAAILETDCTRSGLPQIDVIRRENTSGTPATAPKHHFRSAAAMVENAWNRPGRSRTVALYRKVTSSER